MHRNFNCKQQGLNTIILESFGSNLENRLLWIVLGGDNAQILPIYLYHRGMNDERVCTAVIYIAHSKELSLVNIANAYTYRPGDLIHIAHALDLEPKHCSNWLAAQMGCLSGEDHRPSASLDPWGSIYPAKNERQLDPKLNNAESSQNSTTRVARDTPCALACNPRS